MAAYNYPIFLKHKLEIQDTAVWCITSGSYNSCTDYGDSFIDESSCNNDLSQWGDPTNFTCLPHFPIIITENYVGFVVTSAMAQANPGMTAGTYYIKGSDPSAYSENTETMFRAFGSNSGYCSYDMNGGEPYTLNCEVTGLYVRDQGDGNIGAGETGSGGSCDTDEIGIAGCH